MRRMARSRRVPGRDVRAWRQSASVAAQFAGFRASSKRGESALDRRRRYRHVAGKSEAMVMTEAWEGLKHDRKAVEAVTAALAAMVGNRLVTSRAVREQHANTLT